MLVVSSVWMDAWGSGTHKMPRLRMARREVLVRLFTWTVHKRGIYGSYYFSYMSMVRETYWDDYGEEYVRGDVEGYVDGAQSLDR